MSFRKSTTLGPMMLPTHWCTHPLQVHPPPPPTHSHPAMADGESGGVNLQKSLLSGSLQAPPWPVSASWDSKNSNKLPSCPLSCVTVLDFDPSLLTGTGPSEGDGEAVPVVQVASFDRQLLAPADVVPDAGAGGQLGDPSQETKKRPSTTQSTSLTGAWGSWGDPA